MLDNERKLLFQQEAYRLAIFAALLAFIVIVLGAYTRLTDAGLGCPDWPGCYGKMMPIAAAGIDVKKAWIEMIHRYAAGLLGLTIVILNILLIRNRRPSQPRRILPFFLTALLVFQALLGRWTVTLKLSPLVVVAHLLGGLTTLSLLWLLSLQLKPGGIPFQALVPPIEGKIKNLRIAAGLGLSILVIQLFLGGWTSANYAALVCLDFPYCQANQFFPSFSVDLSHLLSAFNLKIASTANNLSRRLETNALIIIHMAHRLGAMVTAIVLGGLAIHTFRRSKYSTFLRGLSSVILMLITLQILLGIINVLAVLPLPIAVSHNAVAALLLLAVVTLNYVLSLPYKQDAYLKKC